MSYSKPGDPVRGHVHSTDASSGVEIPIFDQGSLVARVLAADEYLEIDQVEVVTVAGGDTAVILDADDGNDIDTGEIVTRGSFAANGGVEKSGDGGPIAVGPVGAKPHVISPTGGVDASFIGRIRKGNGTLQRPSYRAANVPG